jgi:hypothetical protein
MPNTTLGEWTLTLAGRRALLRRVRRIDTAVCELWIDGVLIPPTRGDARRGLPPKGASCPMHGTNERYRDAAVPARVACASCDAPRCLDCLAIDGARCIDCFARATKELAEARSTSNKNVLIAVGAIALVTGVLGAVLHADRLVGGAGAIFFLTAFRVWDNKRRAKKDDRELAQLSEQQRAALQAEAEKLARTLAGGSDEQEELVPEMLDPPESGPYLEQPVRHGERVVLSAGTSLPARVKIAIAPTTRHQREIECELEFAAFRATALRPLSAEDRIVFKIAIAEDGTVTAKARDGDNELRVVRVDSDERRAPVTQRA